jgi:phosphotriesterase-related protein
MSRSELTGKVQTVLGPIAPEDLGITLPHEHLISDGSCWFVEPSEATEKAMVHHPVTLDILWWLRYHLFQNMDDLLLLDEQEAITEAIDFKLAGGNSIVELSNIGLGRDPAALARISRATGLNVIMGSGYYLAVSHGPEMDAKTEEEITDEIVRDIMVGVANSGIRSGIIGEIGCSWPLADNERKSLRAAARAQQLTGAALNVHPGQSEEAAMEIVKILDDAGADLTRTVIDHIDRAVRNPENRIKLAKTGCYLEYDLFGREGYYPMHHRVIDLPNDAQRINEIIELINKGYLNQMLISQDIWNKTQRCAYGGWGYAHILRDTLPVMRVKGMTEEQIHTIMVENPKRLLTFV